MNCNSTLSRTQDEGTTRSEKTRTVTLRSTLYPHRPDSKSMIAPIVTRRSSSASKWLGSPSHSLDANISLIVVDVSMSTEHDNLMCHCATAQPPDATSVETEAQKCVNLQAATRQFRALKPSPKPMFPRSRYRMARADYYTSYDYGSHHCMIRLTLWTTTYLILCPQTRCRHARFPSPRHPTTLFQHGV